MQKDVITDAPDHSKKVKLPKPAKSTDGENAWLIVFACFMINFLSGTIFHNFGPFFVYFSKEFDVPKSSVASIGSLSNGFYSICGPVYGGFLNKFSCRRVATCGFLISAAGMLLSAAAPSIHAMRVTFILAGIGLGNAFAASMSCITHYFSRRRGIAMGITAVGASIGTMSFAPVLNFLFQSYSLSGVMLILAGIYFNGVIFSILMGLHLPKLKVTTKPNSTCECREMSRRSSITLVDENYTQNDTGTLQENKKIAKLYKKKESSTCTNLFCCLKMRELFIQSLKILVAVKNSLNFKLLKFKPFSLLCFGTALHAIAYSITISFLPQTAVSKGIDINNAVLLLSTYAIANIPGKFILGSTADCKRVNVITQFSMCAYISSIIIIVMPFLFNYGTLTCVTVVFGFSTACIGSQLPLMFVEVVGAENFNNGFGISGMFVGISYIIGLTFAGFVYDVTGSYNYPFFMAGGICAMSATIFLFIPYLKNRENKSRASSNRVESSD